MKPGMYRDKNGDLVTVFLTVDGHYMLRYADGRRVFV